MYFAISPVLYVNKLEYFVFTKDLFVAFELLIYPLETPSPNTHNSPGTFTGHRFKSLSNIRIFVFVTGFPIDILSIFSTFLF